MVALDTNILVRFLVQDDAVLAQKATQLLSGLGANDALLDRIVLAELGYVLRSVYGLSKAEVVETYKTILSDKRFMITDRELTALTIDIFGTERPLSFEDSWLLALQQSQKVDALLTFDAALLKRSNRL